MARKIPIIIKLLGMVRILENNWVFFSPVIFYISSCKKFSVLVFLRSTEFIVKNAKMIPLNTWQIEKIFISAFWIFFSFSVVSLLSQVHRQRGNRTIKRSTSNCLWCNDWYELIFFSQKINNKTNIMWFYLKFSMLMAFFFSHVRIRCDWLF